MLLGMVVVGFLYAISDKLPGGSITQGLLLFALGAWIWYVKPTSVETVKEGGKKALIVLIPFWLVILAIIVWLGVIVEITLFGALTSGLPILNILATFGLDAIIGGLLFVIIRLVYRSIIRMLPYLKS
jgi:branched-subunit amino acid ABC-type transport system permease component